MAITYADSIKVTYKCPKCKNQNTVEYDRSLMGIYVQYHREDCEMCGNHGYAKVEVKCPCGKTTYAYLTED